MTDKLDPQAIAALIKYRIERSKETLEAADFMAKGEYYNLAIGRLYYACYYAVSALMLANNISAVTHAGIKAMLHLNFIKKNKLDPKFGAIYQSLFEKRQSGDYEDFVYCDKETYESLRPKAGEFVERIESLIQ